MYKKTVGLIVITLLVLALQSGFKLSSQVNVLAAKITPSPQPTPTGQPGPSPSPTGQPTPTPTRPPKSPTPAPTPLPTVTPSPTPIAGLAGHWKMDEQIWVGDCSTLSVLDSSGNNRHGKACPNGGAPSPVPGHSGNAASFNGTTQYINVGPGFNFIGSFSTSYWAALDDYTSCGPTGASQHLLGTHDRQVPMGNGRGWGTYWDCDGIAWELTNSDGTAIGSYGYVQPFPFPEDGSWHHFAFVYDASIPDAFLYVDGVQQTVSKVGVVPSSLFNNGEPLTVNGLPYSPGAGAPGKMDDVRVYNYALSPTEIFSIFLGP